MRIETHHKLAERNKRLAQFFSLAGFGVLIAGLFIINAPVDTAAPDQISTRFALSFLILPLAYVGTILPVRMNNLWARPPRPETVIPESLKGINPKSVFYSYFHLPARHVLITPTGVYAMVTRYHNGRYRVEGERWHSLRSPIIRFLSWLSLERMGNPNDEARNAAVYVQSLLADIAPNVVVQPLVVFTDPRAIIENNASTVPILFCGNKQTPNLKDYMKAQAKRPQASLTSEQIVAFERKTLPSR